MKDLEKYLEERIKELKKEKEMWLNKLECNEDGYNRLCYLEALAKMNELIDLQIKVLGGEIK